MRFFDEKGCGFYNFYFFIFKNDKKGILRISTAPGNAKIFIDGKRKGNSPSEIGMSFSIELNEGEYSVLAIKPDGEHYEYKGEKKDVFVTDDTIQSIKIKLSRKETEAGRVAREAEAERKRQDEKRQREEYFSRIKAQRNYVKLSATGKELPESA
ncbi:MAG: PEGA domain-containing protein [Oceanospirillaceae bacterium]|nr:PEGA domain-containing protein [Oceanospirillaceae bacterium]